MSTEQYCGTAFYWLFVYEYSHNRFVLMWTGSLLDSAVRTAVVRLADSRLDRKGGQHRASVTAQGFHST
jgi:hypothetical protein